MSWRAEWKGFKRQYMSSCVYIVPREVYHVGWSMWSCLYCTQRGILCWLTNVVLSLLYPERCTVLVNPRGPVYIVPREVYRVGWSMWSCLYCTQRGILCWLTNVVLSLLYPERCTVLVNPRGPVYIVPREVYRVGWPTWSCLYILYQERCTVLVGPRGPVYIVPREVYRVGWPTWSCLYCTQRGVPCWLAHVVLSIYCTKRGVPCWLAHMVLSILYPERCTVLVGPRGPVYIVPREVYRVGWPTWSCLYCTQRGVPCWLAHVVLSIYCTKRGVPCWLTHVVLSILYPERCTVLVGPRGPVYIVPREVYRVGWPTWSCLYCTQRGVPCWLAHVVLSIYCTKRGVPCWWTHVVLSILYPERCTVLVGPRGPVYILYPERCTVLVGPHGPVYILYQERCTVLVNPLGPVYIVPREVYRVCYPMWSCLYCTQRGVPCWLYFSLKVHCSVGTLPPPPSKRGRKSRTEGIHIIRLLPDKYVSSS